MARVHELPEHVLAAAAAGLLGLAATGAATAAGLGVDYEWNPKVHECTTVSPEIRLSGVPEGTAMFEVRLKDHDAPRYRHGGGVVPRPAGDVIPEGAVNPSRYEGPCPPAEHSYEITVRALDGAGNELAKGSAVRRCCD